MSRILYSERDTWPRFSVIEAEGTLTSYLPFLSEKGLKGKAGKLKDENNYDLDIF